MTSRRHPSTRAAQALGWVDPITGGVVPAIHPSVPYVRSENGLSLIHISEPTRPERSGGGGGGGV